MKISKIKLISVFAALLLVLVSFASCKNKDTNGDNTGVGNSSVVIEDIEDDENESLTSEEYEELESLWSEIVSKGDALELVPVTPSSSEESPSNVSSTPASSSSAESTTNPSDEPDNENTSTSSGDGWYPGDWEF